MFIAYGGLIKENEMNKYQVSYWDAEGMLTQSMVYAVSHEFAALSTELLFGGEVIAVTPIN